MSFKGEQKASSLKKVKWNILFKRPNNYRWSTLKLKKLFKKVEGFLNSDERSRKEKKEVH